MDDVHQPLPARRAAFLRARAARRNEEHQRLEKAILTPSTKAEQGGHDQSVSREEILASGMISAKEHAAAIAKRVSLGKRWPRSGACCGHHEIGRRHGTLCFDRRRHTPELAYWYADDYQARFDRGRNRAD